MQEVFYGCEKIWCVPRGHTKRKKMTQAQLAEKIEVTDKAVRKIK